MLRFFKELRRFLIGLVIILSLMEAVAMVRPGMQLKPICLPELSGVQTRLSTLSDKQEQERQSLAALAERVRQKWDDTVQLAELVRDLKQ